MTNDETNDGANFFFASLGGHGRRPGASPVPPEPLPRPPQALFCSPEPYLAVIMPGEGVEVALESHVGHLVAYRDPPEDTHIYTVFTKKCQKRSKGGGTPCF